jgi:hypothetical protein
LSIKYTGSGSGILDVLDTLSWKLGSDIFREVALARPYRPGVDRVCKGSALGNHISIEADVVAEDFEHECIAVSPAASEPGCGYISDSVSNIVMVAMVMAGQHQLNVMLPLETFEVIRKFSDAMRMMQDYGERAIVGTSNNVAKPSSLFAAVRPVAYDESYSAPLEYIAERFC